MKNKEYEFQPFNRIALSLSGGGYRASLFHLGTLFYLNRVQWQNRPLLERVSILSTVSGGTITGLVYTLKVSKGETFDSVYEFLTERLNKVDLAGEALLKLNPGGKWTNEYKEKNLINAFAELYDQYLFGGATLAEFENLSGPLQSVMFNTTEFQNGKNFKFRNKESHQINGTQDNTIPWKIARTIKLADVLAASACFPGGFEPILWPKDFMHSDNVNELTPFLDRPPLGLMDGGIYDNQGLSVLLDYKKGKHDLIMLSDVSSASFDAYKPFELKSAKSSLDIHILTRALKILPLVLWLLLFTSIIATIVFWYLGYGNRLSGFFYGIAMGISLTGFFLVGSALILKSFVKNKIHDLSSGLLAGVNAKFYKEKLGHLEWKRLHLRQILKLLMDRILSVVKLLMDVNIKVIRNLNYNRLYMDDKYTFRRMAVIIDDLTTEKWNRNSPLDLDYYKSSGVLPDSQDYNTFYSDKLRTCVKNASEFGTQLWFTEHEFGKGMPDQLIATGQATTCFQLMKYLDNLIHSEKSPFAQLSDTDQTELRKIYAAVADDFEQFRVDPYWMITRQKNQA